MKRIIILFSFLLASISIIAQEAGGELKGTVKDASSGETIIGATILAAEGKGTVTDVNGNYSIKLDNGEYNVTVSAMGYTVQKAKVKITGKTVSLNFSLEAEVLDEVEIVADIAKVRETPVAISTISALKIKEELASRDIPMVLNSTPGVYATEQGGGSGDARISIRGFDQRNIAVLVDGIPVNDMENGQVYWSNWDGLGDVTKTMQVQRGLGASKLAIPSVGGTMNIITRGIDDKSSVSVRQEVGANGHLKSGFSINSGTLKGDWGITAAGTYKTGEGFADETWTKAYSYFFKVQKRFGATHLLSFSVNGAPQKHGQRTTQLPIALYDKDFARDVISDSPIYTTDDQGNHIAHTPTDAQVDSIVNEGILFEDYSTLANGSRGIRFNPGWGRIDRWELDSNGDTIHDRENFNTKVNYFHKPQFNLSHFWNASDRLYISTVAYLSIGNGGGTGLSSSTGRDMTDGSLLLQNFYNTNNKNIDPNFSATETKATRYVYTSRNDHTWYGLLSSASLKANEKMEMTFGIDGRYYKGKHFREVYDLLGGDYMVDYANQTIQQNYTTGAKHVGDTINYYNEGIVLWGGLFAQAEYKTGKWSTFLTVTGSETGYKRTDYFAKKDIVLADTTLSQVIGFGQTYTYNGATYTFDSPEVKTSQSILKWFPGFTVKGGANYNINEHHNVYANTGYLIMAPKFSTVFNSKNQLQDKGALKNQKVMAFELGYGAKFQKIAGNVNLYHTTWQNKPLTTFSTIRIAGDDYYFDVNGLDAIHKGVELDLQYKPFKQMEIEAITSIGDWVVNSNDSVYLYDINSPDVVAQTLDFSAKGVHVGDAAQIQYGLGVRYEPVKNVYVKARFTVFDKNYANYDLLNLSGANKDRESWKMPAYSLLDVHAGYKFDIWKLKMNISGSLLNALDNIYITDARNGSEYDAGSALVYLGPGRRFVTSLVITY
jgi:hypothetical protein